MTVAVLTAWLAASSQNDRSPKGDTILRGPYGELVSVGLDDVPPEAPAGCLALFTLVRPAMPLHGRRQRVNPGCLTGAPHVAWLAGAGRGFPVVVTVAAGQTMRQACTAAGIDPDGDSLIVGVPAEAFAQ